jgi:hypothetical protein
MNFHSVLLPAARGEGARRADEGHPHDPSPGLRPPSPRFAGRGAIAVVALLLTVSAYAQPLPPALPWSGKSRELIAKSGDPWITPAEKSAFRFSPSYDETVAWLRTLDAAAPEIQMVSLGKSPEGRDLWMVIATRERAFTPEALRRKPVVLAQGGIHSGEIDGKDAGLMLLRDMTVAGRRRDLLDRVNFLFVPIFNVDGHERASRSARVNQRGPEVMGWRTTSRNLNLNRDYTKLDSPEMRAMVAALDRWKPDLYLDLHVTDGADYQYDITWGWNRTTGWSPSIVKWLDSTLQPALERDLAAMGHVPGPLVFPIVDGDVSSGLSGGNSNARLSTGYADLRHMGHVLLENHSLKPYEQRVLGTVVFLTSVLEIAGRAENALRSAISEDENRRARAITVAWTAPDLKKPSRTIDFLGVESRKTLSPISGTVRTEYLGRPITVRVPVFEHIDLTTVSRPKAYWIPPAWSDVAARLKLHGIAMEQTSAPRELDVEMYRLENPKLGASPFEGHVMLKTGARVEKRRERFPAGSWRISTDQPLGELAALLLEPLSEDSFLQWGFFHEILQRTEYIEDYVAEPLAEQMLAADPNLAEEFRRKIEEDAAFRTSPEARLRWFYQRSPYWDERWLLYPVAREP